MNIYYIEEFLRFEVLTLMPNDTQSLLSLKNINSRSHGTPDEFAPGALIASVYDSPETYVMIAVKSVPSATVFHEAAQPSKAHYIEICLQDTGQL